jgi:hypothetical protein
MKQRPSVRHFNIIELVLLGRSGAADFRLRVAVHILLWSGRAIDYCRRTPTVKRRIGELRVFCNRIQLLKGARVCGNGGVMSGNGGIMSGNGGIMGGLIRWRNASRPMRDASRRIDASVWWASRCRWRPFRYKITCVEHGFHNPSALVHRWGDCSTPSRSYGMAITVWNRPRWKILCTFNVPYLRCPDVACRDGRQKRDGQKCRDSFHCRKSFYARTVDDNRISTVAIEAMKRALAFAAGGSARIK